MFGGIINRVLGLLRRGSTLRVWTTRTRTTIFATSVIRAHCLRFACVLCTVVYDPQQPVIHMPICILL